ncbi:hypothetical protein BY996DRAFT_4211174 [Phakopsora pachyrhizi]|uniref:Uncharacterized protein n=1 Tax=Phakopsora pachyrhizi TaxID=170000 RepID=A0AAV0ALB5_PHAPC|nr:hypothetical protein BY996DRAFT_4211174 [Phakopsora pachyrhizi]CAH7667891.1 hypothetical protein PPACK8108_LOCUS2331 [Phakopsora pachyrhizi]
MFPASSSSDAAGSRTYSPSNNKTGTQPTKKILEVEITDPLGKLESKTWLHGRSKKDVYKLLIDIYRLHEYDNYNGGVVEDGSIMTGDVTCSIVAFKRFVERIEKNNRQLLPAWWNEERKMECFRHGLNPEVREYLGFAIEKHDIVEDYGDNWLPMQMRFFTQSVFSG